MLRVTSIVLMLLSAATSAMASENSTTSSSAGAESTIATPTLPSLVPEKRPGALPALYVSFAALQIFDARTTSAAMSRGAHEANPLIQGNQAAFWAVKAATAASTIYFVERIWKKNRVAAVLVMAGINGGYAAIAAHNMRQGR